MRACMFVRQCVRLLTCMFCGRKSRKWLEIEARFHRQESGTWRIDWSRERRRYVTVAGGRRSTVTLNVDLLTQKSDALVSDWKCVSAVKFGENRLVLVTRTNGRTNCQETKCIRARAPAFGTKA